MHAIFRKIMRILDFPISILSSVSLAFIKKLIFYVPNFHKRILVVCILIFMSQMEEKVDFLWLFFVGRLVQI